MIYYGYAEAGGGPAFRVGQQERIPKMTRLRIGALALFHTKPAVVRSITADKFAIDIAGGDSKNVRAKDLEFLHAGPCASPSVCPAETGDCAEIAALMESDTFPFAEFTELLCGNSSPSAAYAAYLAIQDDLYFTGSPAEGVRAKSADEVARKLDALRVKEDAKRAYEGRLERIRTGSLLPEDRPSMSEIEQVAYGVNPSSRLLKDLGIEATPEKAQSLLLKLGVWTWRDDPLPRRAGIEVGNPGFPEETMPAEQREDLTAMTAYAIDDEGSDDPDDAIGFADGLLWVHVADPAAVATPGSALDLEARARGETLYLASGRARMLPVWMTDCCALGVAEQSPALSFGIRIDPDSGNATLEKMTLSTVKVQRHTYESFEEIEDNADIRALKDSLESFRRGRVEAGALMIRLPEVKIKADTDGTVHIRPLPMTESRELVANAMLAAGNAVGKFADEHGIPLPFAVQDEPEPTEGGDTLSVMFARRKSCVASVTRSFAGRHAGLGLEPYVCVTSPLRRYCDLLAHQQLRRHLKNEELFTYDDLDSALAVSEKAAYERRRLERRDNEYWTLVYLVQRGPGWETEAVPVFKQDDRRTLLIPEIAYEFKTRFGGSLPFDQPVRVQLQNADPVSFRARMRFVFSTGAQEMESEEVTPDSDAEKKAE